MYLLDIYFAIINNFLQYDSIFIAFDLRVCDKIVQVL